MGCDIHLYIEKRVGGVWTAVGEFTREEPEDGQERGWIHGGNAWRGRNYNLFAILADVRNGRGFAGCKTGEGFAPIAEPRGVPRDASDTYREIVDQWNGDGHSHSHFTLGELLDYDWTQKTALQGWVDAVEYATWTRWRKGIGKGPESYCGGVSGGSVRHVTEAEMIELLKPVEGVYGPEREAFAKELGSVYALVSWEVSYVDAAGGFFESMVTRLLKLAGGIENAHNVRIVFFFDN